MMIFKYSSFFFLCCIPLFGISQHKKKNASETGKKLYSLKGQVSKSSSRYVYLVYKEGKVEHRDTVLLTNEQFKFSGHVKSPVFAWLYTDKLDLNTRFWLENAPLVLQSTNLGSYTITGGTIATQQRRLDDLLASYKNQKMVLEGQASKMNTPLYTDAMLRLEREKDDVIKGFIRAHPQSPVSTEQLAVLAVSKEADYAQLSELYGRLSKEQQTSNQGIQVYSYIQEQIKKAQPQIAPDFSLLDAQGKIVHLSDYKGKYVLLDFWASWCGPCRKENPNVLKAYERFHKKGLEILAVSLDNDRASWLAAIKQEGLPWKHVSDMKGWKSEPVKLYQVMGIPDNFLIDPSGVIIARGLREESLQDKLTEVLGAK